MKLYATIIAFIILAARVIASTPEEIVNRLNENFSRIRDAQGEITLDTSLKIFGCGGLYRQKGHLYFKAPDRVMAVLENTRYFIKGNNIRKIDPDGKRQYIRLIHAPDFNPGFNPRLITHNFKLKVVSETGSEIVLEGLPRPGVLKNVKRVIFHIDPRENVLRSMDLSIANNLKGKINIKYENNIPIATFGESALELNRGILAGLYFNLSGKDLIVNRGLPDKLFDPGF